MQPVLKKETSLKNTRVADTSGFCVGIIIGVTEEGRALVDYHGNLAGPIEARSILDRPSEKCSTMEGSIPVLLYFEKGNPGLPIVVGIIHDTLYPAVSQDEVLRQLKQPSHNMIDSKTIFFNAQDEIVLHCGKSSVTLNKDGKVIVKGKKIISRASETNKIKGATVSIN